MRMINWLRLCQDIGFPPFHFHNNTKIERNFKYKQLRLGWKEGLGEKSLYRYSSN
jgi:hypothetical protein